MNRFGAISFLIGLILILAVWSIAFSPNYSTNVAAGVFALVATTIVGGIVLLGVLLILLGLLMLVL